jgi:hypothetical protein
VTSAVELVSAAEVVVGMGRPAQVGQLAAFGEIDQAS